MCGAQRYRSARGITCSGGCQPFLTPPPKLKDWKVGGYGRTQIGKPGTYCSPGSAEAGTLCAGCTGGCLECRPEPPLLPPLMPAPSVVEAQRERQRQNIPGIEALVGPVGDQSSKAPEAPYRVVDALVEELYDATDAILRAIEQIRRSP